MSIRAEEKNLRRRIEIDELVEAEYLGISEQVLRDIKIENPFYNRTPDDIENPHKHLLRMVINPKYLGFTAKYIFGINLMPFQLVILKELWSRKYPMLITTRGGSKSYLLALYAMLKALLNPGIKIVVVGAAFRQSKVVFEYCENMWHNAPILRDIVGSTNRRNGPRRDIDRCTLRMGDSIIIALPLGDGTKIRGQRAGVIIADEFASIPKAIFQNVVEGFASVSSSPDEAVKRAARIRVLRRKGKNKQADALEIQEGYVGNQTIVAGTADYGFKHFADAWRQYKAIVNSQGDEQKVLEIFKGKIPKKFNCKNYAVVRLPAVLLPENFMDEEHIAKSQATTDKSIHDMEFGAVFAMDSNGFFKRSLIESCVVKPENLPMKYDDIERFTAKLRGDPKLEYIYSIDPASESDNFCITILEMRETHRRVVYCWTTDRIKFREMVRKGEVAEKNFYGYCARKIRLLMRAFPCKYMMLDAQGGGKAGVYEALNDPDKMMAGEQNIWEVREDGVMKHTDKLRGLHILEFVEFARADWVREANHGLKKDLEDQKLVFPYFDPIQLWYAAKLDKKNGTGEYDTIEDAVTEVEQMKEELATIVHTQTAVTHRDRWDTPEVIGTGGRKGHQRKDRYSALLMANMAARQFQKTIFVKNDNNTVGGFANQIVQEARQRQLEKKEKGIRPLYAEGPEWFMEQNKVPLGKAVVRQR